MEPLEAIIVSAIFTLLGIQLVDLIIIIAIATTVTILIWLPLTFYVVYGLGRYPPLLKKDEIKMGSSSIGEYFGEKFKKVLIANFFIAFSLFITLIYLFNTLPSIFVDLPNSLIAQNTTIEFFNCDIPIKMSQSNFSTPDIAFILTLFVIPAFLLSLRLLANPRRDLKWFIFTNISKKDENSKIKFFKEQIISLYFAFIATTIAIFYFAVCFTAMKYNPITVFNVLLSFYPHVNDITILFDIIVEILSIIAITYLGEKYLQYYEPIDKE